MTNNYLAYKQKYSSILRDTKNFINIDPLQTGGKLTTEAFDALKEWGDGYSVCDFCQGSLDHINKPPINSFVHEVLPEFIGIENVKITNGAREAKFAIFHNLKKENNDYVVMDSLAHYSSKLAAERNGLDIIFTENSNKPFYTITEEDFINSIELGIKKYNKKPIIVLITYPDGNYGNLLNLKTIVNSIHEYDIPVLLNGAYCIGRMPFKAYDFDVDFVVGSGHKSMSSCGPIGILGFSNKFKDSMLRKSIYSKIKDVEFLGCTSRSVSIMTLMASFPKVLKRTSSEVWNMEVSKSRKFIKLLEDTNQFHLLGQNPHSHDLIFFESPGFYNVSTMCKDGRYFLYNELKNNKIHGIKPGLTKNFKMSTYGLSNDEVNIVYETFINILKKYDQI